MYNERVIFKQKMIEAKKEYEKNPTKQIDEDNLDVLFYYESDNIVQIENCIKVLMKPYQYRKYKEVYKINIDIIKSLIEQCDNIIISTEDKVKLSKLKHDDTKNYYINISK